ncbi:MAG: alanine--tRNA ligase [Alphaproteobacteria bacterium]|nr:alanine--tRNA ligase [Alphaproteobacteria bacterium]
MFTAADIRDLFLDYFSRHEHTRVPSAPLIPRNDPSLMFVNAGMVPFKNGFTGVEKLPYSRAVSSQKCVRAGGKHNDLENVGHTARHHTFFEMLGNFSFGDYFKERAIELAWRFITQELKIPKDRLLVTVYSEDLEAATLWKKIAGLNDDRIIKISTTDNFWSMGDTGPCGPCSEIFYDHGEEIPGGPPGSPTENGDRFIEIWNLVFMQYEQVIPGDLSPSGRIALPKPSIDTGMGLERLTAVMQGVHDNYDIDIFTSLIHASEEITGVSSQGPYQASHRIIADHLRSASFLLADGVNPSNEGRGYVLRRIMRRAMRHAYLLKSKSPLMWQLVPTLIAKMGAAYPELGRAEALIIEVLKLEEERFKQMLERGLKLLTEETKMLPAGVFLPGDIAFKLYDTYGFPLDLTQEVLRSEQRDVDTAGFERAMEQQKAEARASWVGAGGKKDEKIWFEIHERCGATEFLGYNEISAEGLIVAIVKDGVETNTAQQGETIILLCNQTPFYAESGGQIGDTGRFTSNTGTQIEILDTLKKPGDLYAHIGRVINGQILVGETVKMDVNSHRRASIKANHSATHLLHAALRQYLGEHVTQKGSLVTPDRLRFDFSHNRGLSREDIQALECEVNQLIRANTPVTTNIMTPETAEKQGAIALFGEKYHEEVRVVAIGYPQQNLKPFSLELCGGTHVNQTGDIGYFKIINETGIAAGIRRIEALTGNHAEQYVFQLEQVLLEEAHLLNVPLENINQRLQSLLEENKTLKKILKDTKHTSITKDSSTSRMTKDLGGTKFVFYQLQDIEPKDLRPLADQIKKDIGSGIFMITTVIEGKVSFVIGVTSDLTKRYNAVKLSQIVTEILESKGGGGRPDLAQGGGNKPDQLPFAVEKLQKSILDETSF